MLYKFFYYDGKIDNNNVVSQFNSVLEIVEMADSF